MLRAHHPVGFHASIAGGFHHALEEAEAFGCEAIQIFTKSNRQWSASPIGERDLALYHEAYRRARKQQTLRLVFGHSGYLINLAASNPETLQKSRESLLLELERSALLELPFLVLHPGSANERSVPDGLKTVVESLEWVFARTQSPTKVALETTAGAGSVLGSRVEELAWLLQNTPSSSRLAICLDTCHLFASGYDLRTASDVAAFVKNFRRHIDWKRVVAVHLNDSVGPLGGRLDRHAQLGEGALGWECFRAIMQSPFFAQKPLCLEIPPGGEGRPNDVVALKRLKAARKRA